MGHFLFFDYETEEEFIVGAENLDEARNIAESFFSEPSFSCELSDYDAELSGLDEY